MNYIEVKNKNVKPKYGNNTIYFKYKDKGFKLFQSYDTKEEVFASAALREAELEARNLKEARKRFKFVPKCYNVAIVKYKNKYFPAIVMEHIKENTLKKIFSDDPYNDKLINLIDNIGWRLYNSGIEHNDLHADNIIEGENGEYYVIDFDWRYINFL